MSTYQVTNPATNQVEQQYNTASDQDIGHAIDSAQDAFTAWRHTGLDERQQLLRDIANLYQQRRDQLAAIITQEMGKPISQARGEIDIVTNIFNYYADNGPKLLADRAIDDVKSGSAKVEKRPLGVLFGIMPWNFPQYQVARFVAPNVMAGNTIILKHAPQCPKTAEAIVQLFADAGMPKGVYNNVYASNEQAATIIQDPRVQGVSLTGSERAGQAVAQEAGKALKKVVLELGGSDPFIVLDDADIDQAVRCALSGRFGNTGQACNAAKRIIVTSGAYERFAEQFVEKVKAIAPADPTLDDTFVGPLSSVQAATDLQAQLKSAQSEGATTLVEGGQRQTDSAWFDPVVLTDIKKGMQAYHQELFGPVAVLYKVADNEAAIQLANDVPFGLGAAIHTQDQKAAANIAEALDVGMVTINGSSSSEAKTPFGGVKRSGFGRELGELGITEFLNHKLVRNKTNA